MNDLWPTPAWLRFMFPRDLWFDPCPLDPPFDGLKIGWGLRNWVNPPYSKPLPWIEKALYEYTKGNRSALLLREDASTEVYHLLHSNGAHILRFDERLDHGGDGGSARHSSILACLMDNTPRTKDSDNNAGY
jgi:hypothetical protein